jgi:hypothetical protein
MNILPKETYENCPSCQEYADLINRQNEALLPAIRLWQEAHGKPDSHPDLKELVDWMISEREFFKESSFFK